MLFLLDTNIVLAYFRKDTTYQYVEASYKPLNDENFAIISVVSLGEIYAIALKNQWGEAKRQRLTEALVEIKAIDIYTQDIIRTYAEIDAYSQNKIRSKPLPQSLTARNMGKNDLWIAACASVIEATLLTTDQDFNHLHQVYLDVIQIPVK